MKGIAFFINQLLTYSRKAFLVFGLQICSYFELKHNLAYRFHASGVDKGFDSNSENMSVQRTPDIGNYEESSEHGSNLLQHSSTLCYDQRCRTSNYGSFLRICDDRLKQVRFQRFEHSSYKFHFKEKDRFECSNHHRLDKVLPHFQFTVKLLSQFPFRNLAMTVQQGAIHCHPTVQLSFQV